MPSLKSSAVKFDFTLVTGGHFGFVVEVSVQGVAGLNALAAVSGQLRERMYASLESTPSARFNRDSRSRCWADIFCSVPAEVNAASPMTSMIVIRMIAVTST
jgi:hypothetical protein